MSTLSPPTFNVCKNESCFIFYELKEIYPEKIVVNRTQWKVKDLTAGHTETANTHLSSSQDQSVAKISKLIQNLAETGPFSIRGRLGSGAYVNSPTDLNEQLGNHSLYGWQKGSQKTFKHSNVIVVDAQQTGNKEFVYLLETTTMKRNSWSKVYKISFTNFLDASAKNQKKDY